MNMNYMKDNKIPGPIKHKFHQHLIKNIFPNGYYQLLKIPHTIITQNPLPIKTINSMTNRASCKLSQTAPQKPSKRPENHAFSICFSSKITSKVNKSQMN